MSLLRDGKLSLLLPDKGSMMSWCMYLYVIIICYNILCAGQTWFQMCLCTVGGSFILIANINLVVGLSALLFAISYD